jgi:tetratricopeptide (TPR) repeat protein
MSRPILCIGSYAENPYHIEKIGKNVYCIEELCYCIVKNAFLLDEESFDLQLFDWIEQECSLVKLADELRSMAAKRCSMAALAGTILDYVGYNTRKEVDRTEEILRGNAGMDVYQKKLARADFLLKNGRYAMAFREYEFLLNNTPDMDRKLRASIEHNEGVMYARLFLFEKAAERFLKAFEDSGDKESYYQYLSAIRMNLSNKEYVSFIADSDEAYEASMEIESRMKEAEELYSASEDNHMLGTLSVYKAEGKMHEYYQQVGDLTDRMKYTYRELVKDRVR